MSEEEKEEEEEEDSVVLDVLRSVQCSEVKDALEPTAKL